MQGGSAARLHLFTTNTANRGGQKRRHLRYSCLGSLSISDGFARHQDKNEPFAITKLLVCPVTLRDLRRLKLFSGVWNILLKFVYLNGTAGPCCC